MILSYRGKSPHIHPSVFIAPGAQIVGDVTIGAGSSVWCGAVLRADLAAIRIGRNSNIQDNAVVHVDTGTPCVIGDDVIVGHQATVHACRIERGALIGIGARILSRSNIGKGAIVAAGAVVREDARVAAGMLAVGIPAKTIRAVSLSEKKYIIAGAIRYKKLAGEYRRTLG